MSDDKQKEVLTGYEQLKRRNRRRLVMTSGLVVVAGILLTSISGTDNGGKQNAPAPTAAAAQKDAQVDAVSAAVLEPSSSEEIEAAAKEQAPATESIRPEPPVEVLKPAAATPPQDIGPPLVLINDKLVDSDIKGLEESERIRKAEEEKRAAEEQKAEARRQRLAEQRAAKRAEEKRLAAEKEAVKKRAAAAKAEKSKRDAEAERKQAEKAAAERKAKQTEEKKAVAAKAKAEAEKKAAAAKARETEKKTAAKKAESAKSKTSEKAADTQSKGQKAAIQAGYADKERAQSLQRKMKAAGINATISEIKTDKGVVYRVKSNAYKSRQEAAKDLEKLRSKDGIAGQVVNE
ncbi:SPOR domain-containing protein [Neisseria iguanae]|uniref:Cell division protein FtsN n=1 Tax=Neisseria iguanae TaxID=90242 RepID=A0A2P7U073_9NEIS|nr:SPOR domain-containing protein [Neisseria iguanae]PSJ80359.1 cell division protein FtsN [Neisseria iguanae]